MRRVRTLVLGAGAAGLMAAAHAGPDVLVVDHAKAPGEKIRISGGGRCNFTNLGTAPERFLGRNPHFHKSALSRYTQWDFIDLVDRYRIPWHEKTLGQLFCDRSAKDIIAMLLAEASNAEVWLRTEIREIGHDGEGFTADLDREGRPEKIRAKHLVVATGGKSIPKMGATGLAYRLAERFGHGVTETRPGLVPFTFGDELADLKALAGIAVDGRVAANGAAFDEAVLFTHRGLSGPAALQASSYWREGEEIAVDFCPGADLGAELKSTKARHGGRLLATALAEFLPSRLATTMAERDGLNGPLAEARDARLDAIGTAVNDMRLRPASTEGYRTAEVTVGGIDTEGLSSRTMMSKTVPGLYFIGEAVDVTGWLGGYNFQWAWSSGWAAGTAIAAEHEVSTARR